jgi:hypothetical protein
VVLDGSRTAPTEAERFEVTTNAADVVDQIHELSASIGNRVLGLKPDRAMVQRADFFKMASNQDGPRVRLLAEGAIAAAVRGKVPITRCLVGRDVATHAGVTKDALQAEAAAVVNDDGYVEAAGAALAMLDP